MNKPLIAALIFTACAFVFLAGSGAMYFKADAERQAVDTQWAASEKNRTSFVSLRPQVDESLLKNRKIDINLNEILLQLTKELKVAESQLHVKPLSTQLNQPKYNVVLDSLTIETTGKLLQLLRAQHPYLQIRDLKAQAAKKEGDFNWTMTVAGPVAESTKVAPAKPADTLLN